MSVFWTDGEKKIRPGIYRRNKDRGKDADDVTRDPGEIGGEGSQDIIVTTDGEGNVFVTAPGWIVAHDGEGSVDVYEIARPISYNQTDGIVMIGG